MRCCTLLEAAAAIAPHSPSLEVADNSLHELKGFIQLKPYWYLANR